MILLSKLCHHLEAFAPLHLAEDWDNVGLLVGDRNRAIEAVMTCLTVTPDSAAEAIQGGADLIVTHHPLPFRPLSRITNESTPGRLVLQLIENKVAVYSPHTAFDSAEFGINQQLTQILELERVQSLQPHQQGLAEMGSGRRGSLRVPQPIAACLQRLKNAFASERFGLVGRLDRPVQEIAVACGSGGQFLEDAVRNGCELLVTGEASFHTCLEADAQGVALLLLGHFVSERFAVVSLADRLAAEFSGLRVWASCQEADPLRWV